MIIKAVDDLHFEFHRDRGRTFARNLPTGGYLDTDINQTNFIEQADVLVLAGDITTQKNGYVALEEFCQNFKHVVYILGNHDHYHSTATDVAYEIHETIELLHLENLHFLQNESVTLDGVNFHGSTLWIEKTLESAFLERYLNDFNYVMDGRDWIYSQYIEAVGFLSGAIQPSDVVVTHHLPSFDLVSPIYAGDPINIFYASNLNSLIERTKASYWFHGHSHESCNIKIGDTKCIRNPYGYQGQEVNRNWNPNALFEV